MMSYRAITAPPTDFDDWHHLVRALVQAATAKYGEQEVLKWSFECWNELWGMAFPTPYMSLYNASVAAVKAVNPKYKVGGPATSQLEGQLGGVGEFVREAKARGLDFDFVSTHFCESLPRVPLPTLRHPTQRCYRRVSCPAEVSNARTVA